MVGHLVVLGGDPAEAEEEVADDLQDEKPLEQKVEALGARPAFDSRLLERLVVHLVLHELLHPRGTLRLDAADHRVALEEVDGLPGGGRAVGPIVEGTPARAPSAPRVLLRARRIRKHRGPFLEAVGGVVAAPIVGLEDVVEVLVVLALFPRRAPLLPGQGEADHQEEDVGEKAAGARRHGEDGSLHAPRDGLSLAQGQGLPHREGEQHVHVLEELALFERARALERVPPEADEELDLRGLPVLDDLEDDTDDLLGPALEPDDSARHLFRQRPCPAEVVHIHVHREGEGLRRPSHVQDDVHEEDLEDAWHAACAEITSHVGVQVQRVLVALAWVEPMEQERPDPRRKREHREGRLNVSDVGSIPR